MNKTYRKPKLGLLLLGAERFRSLGEGTARGSYLERKAQEAAWMQRDCAEHFDVVFPGVVYTREHIHTAIDAFAAQKVDFVLAIYLSWAEDFAWIHFLRDMPPVPILFAHRMRDEIGLHDTHDDDEFTEYLCCGGLVGMQEASGDNVRFNRPMMETALGTWKEVLARAQVFGNAARARALLRSGVVGHLACYNEAMWSTYVDPYNMFMKVGPELRFLSVAQLTDHIAAISDDEAQAATDAITARYEVLPDVDRKKLLASVRASMGMENLAAEYGLDLLVLNDIDTVLFKNVGLRPGFWPTRPDVSTLVVPEGDLGGGIATYLLQLLSGKPVHFIEPFHIDLPENNFAAGHAGPNDYTDPDGSTKIARDVRFAKSAWKYAGAPFAWHVFAPGEKTMLHCSEHNGRFQLVATRVECLPTEHFLATYSHALFRAIGQTNAQLFEKLLKIGVTQHYGIVAGNYLPQLRDVAKLLDFDYHEV